MDYFEEKRIRTRISSFPSPLLPPNRLFLCSFISSVPHYSIHFLPPSSSLLPPLQCFCLLLHYLKSPHSPFSSSLHFTYSSPPHGFSYGLCPSSFFISYSSPSSFTLLIPLHISYPLYSSFFPDFPSAVGPLLLDIFHSRRGGGTFIRPSLIIFSPSSLLLLFLLLPSSVPPIPLLLFLLKPQSSIIKSQICSSKKAPPEKAQLDFHFH